MTMTRPRTGLLPMLQDDALAQASANRTASAMRYLDDVRSSLPKAKDEYLIGLVEQEYAMTHTEARNVYRQWLGVQR